MDVRVVAASNVDLEQAARERRFREDLYYRLNVVPIHMPALRERRDDIPLLLEHFLEKISRAENAPPKQITPETAEYLKTLEWPGNVRQLEHAVQKAFALSGDRLLLYPSDFSSRQDSDSQLPLQPPISHFSPFRKMASISMKQSAGLNCSLLNQALAASGGNKARAADLLKIKRTTLLAKMKTFEEKESPEGGCSRRFLVRR